jgi:hypothetical protein
MPVGQGSRVTAVSRRSVRVTPVLFSIPLGFAALAGLWRLAAAGVGAPLVVAEAVAVIGVSVDATLWVRAAGPVAHTHSRLLPT